MEKLTLALDWTPNVNHIGFFIAKELGFYSQEGIELEILNPQDDNYALTPGKKLELDIADFAIAPFETVISLNNKTNKVEALAVFAILQEDVSSIATLQSSAITSPKMLAGKTYASYKARYEDAIVKEMMKQDGGEADLHIIYPDKLGIWNTLLSGQADATWIFNNWEGIEADGKQIALTQFSLDNYGVPYGYSPVLLTKKKQLENHKALYVNFINATKKGYLFVKEHVPESVTILKQYLTAYDLQHIDIEKAILFSIPYFGNAITCGVMQEERVRSFIQWIADKGLEDKVILTQRLFTNELLS